MTDEMDPLHNFARELKLQLDTYFSDVYDVKDPSFNPIYSCATYLSPCHKVLLTTELVREAKKYLQGERLIL